MDKFMYYVEGTGIAWVDYNKEGIQLNPQHQSVLDMSIKTIEQYVYLLESILVEWEKLSGVNRQRQGQVGSYEGKATSQQAIVQSSHITEDIFRKFNRLEQRDLQALLDYSKEAWLTGKKAMYIMPDGTTEFLDLETMEHMESEYGVFMSDSGKDQDKLMAIKTLAQSMVQNGVPASTIAEMVDAENFSEIKLKISSAEKQLQELAQAQQQAEQEMRQAELEQKERLIQNDNMNQEKDRETQIKVAEIRADVDQTKMRLELEKGVREMSVKEKELDIKREDVSEKSRANKSQESLKRDDIKSKKDIKREDNKSRERVAKSKPKPKSKS